VIGDVQVEHELRQSAWSFASPPIITTNRASGNAPRGLKIHADPFTERDMVLGREVELRG